MCSGAVTPQNALASVNDPQPTITHINKLPNELLLSILGRTSTEDPLLDHLDGTVLRLSHVCRRWRYVILSAPEMWSTVPRINTRWTKLCLERSRDVLLDISVDSKEWIRCIPAIHSVLLHMERARSLYLWLEDLCRGVVRTKDLLWNDDVRVARKKILDELVMREAPNLERMHLGFDGRFVIDDYFTAPSLPNGLFGGKSMPQLKDISLEYCIITPPTFIRLLSAAAALTHLYLRDVRAWDSVDDMVRCLNAAPRLRSFHWVDKGISEHKNFAAKRSQIYAPRCVHLDELMELRLGGSHTQNMVIFSYLSIPGTTRLTVNSGRSAWSTSHDGHGEIEDSTALFAEALRSHFACASARGAYFDSVFMVGNVGVRVEPGVFTNTINDIAPPSLSKLLPATLALSWPQLTNGHHRKNFLNTFLSLPVFNRARSVNYCSPDVIRRFCEVHEIRIWDPSHLREFCAAFVDPRPCPLPRLDRLHLENMDLITHADASRDLVKAVQLAGSPIRRLAIVRCNIEEATYEALIAQLGAGAVRWDRK